MGITGYALRGDAVCYINDFIYKQETTLGDLVAQTSSSRNHILTPAQQAFVGHILAKDSPYNRKIDNFCETETIENLVIGSLQDEEFVGEVKSIGVL